MVVKTIPKGLTAVRNRDIVRQGTLMAALHAHGLEVPEVIAIDPGDPPESPPVMVTSFVEGDSFDPTSPNAAQESAPSAAETAARALAAMGLLARIQHVTATELGIDAGAERSISSELAHWSRAFETTSYAEDPIVTRTRGLLESTIPAEGRRVLVHGDYRLGNMLCTGASIRAVIDWEIGRSEIRGSTSGGSSLDRARRIPRIPRITHFQPPTPFWRRTPSRAGMEPKSWHGSCRCRRSSMRPHLP